MFRIEGAGLVTPVAGKVVTFSNQAGDNGASSDFHSEMQGMAIYLLEPKMAIGGACIPGRRSIYHSPSTSPGRAD